MSLHARLCSVLLLAAALASQQVGVSTPAAPGGASSDRAAERQVEGLIQAARAGDAVAFWEWLPGSYRDDLEGLVHDFADRIDAKVYARAMKLAVRVADVALEKQSLFFANPEVARAMAMSPEGLRPGRETFRAVMTLLRDVGSSDLGTVEGLRSFDGEAFLQKSGESLLRGLFAIARTRGRDPLAQLERVEVRTLRQRGDEARLEMCSDGEPVEIKNYVRVEGQWLPAELAADWAGAMRRARSKLAALPEGGDRNLMAQARFTLGMIEGYVREFEDAETQEEFDAVMQRIMDLSSRGKRGRAR